MDREGKAKELIRVFGKMEIRVDGGMALKDFFERAQADAGNFEGCLYVDYNSDLGHGLLYGGTDFNGEEPVSLLTVTLDELRSI